MNYILALMQDNDDLLWNDLSGGSAITTSESSPASSRDASPTPQYLIGYASRTGQAGYSAYLISRYSVRHSHLQQTQLQDVPMRPGLTNDTDNTNDGDNPASTLITPAPSNPIPPAASGSSSVMNRDGRDGTGSSTLPLIVDAGQPKPVDGPAPVNINVSANVNVNVNVAPPRSPATSPIPIPPRIGPPRPPPDFFSSGSDDIPSPSLSFLEASETGGNRTDPDPLPDHGPAPSFPMPLTRPGEDPDSPTGPPGVYTLHLVGLVQNQVARLNRETRRLESITGLVGATGPQVPVAGPSIPSGLSNVRPARSPNAFSPPLPTPTTQISAGLAHGRNADGLSAHSIDDHGFSQPRNPLFTHEPLLNRSPPRKWNPDILPPGTNTRELWVDPFIYRAITGHGYLTEGGTFGDEERDRMEEWLWSDSTEAMLGPLGVVWTGTTTKIMMDPDERPAPFAVVRNHKMILHIALHRIDIRTEEFDGIPERHNKLPDEHRFVGEDSVVMDNIVNGHQSYYLRVFPCFCTPPITALKTPSQLHPYSNLQFSLVPVADCPNRSVSSHKRQRRGPGPGTGPVAGPSTTTAAPAASASRIPSLSERIAEAYTRESQISPLDLGDRDGRFTSRQRADTSDWARKVHDGNTTELEPLEFAYPVIDEVKWAAERSIPSINVTQAESPARPGATTSSIPANPDLPPLNLIPENPDISPLNLGMRVPISAIPNLPSEGGRLPPPRYSRGPAPPRYTAAPPRTGSSPTRNRDESSPRPPMPARRSQPFAHRTYSRGHASTTRPRQDPPPSVPSLSNNGPSIISLERPVVETLTYFSRHLPPNPTDAQVTAHMADPVVARELERHRLIYSLDSEGRHIWTWRGPAAGGSEQPDPQCLLM